MVYVYDYPRPAVTVDCIVFGMDSSELHVLLIQRAHDPFSGKWAFPGGFVEMDEPLVDAAKRELVEETGILLDCLEQMYAVGTPGRDPRGRTISVVYFTIINVGGQLPLGDSDARQAAWIPLSQAKELAFDHDEILQQAVNKLQQQVRDHPFGLSLLPPSFTMPMLVAMYEKILMQGIDAEQLEKTMSKLGLIEPIGRKKHKRLPRSERRFRFNRHRYQEITDKGLLYCD